MTFPSHASPSSIEERRQPTASDVIRQHYVDLHNILSVSPETLFSVSARCYKVYLMDTSTKTAINLSASQVGSSILLDHIQMKLEQSGDYLPLVLSIFKEEVAMENVVSKMESFVAETVKDKETIRRPTVYTMTSPHASPSSIRERNKASDVIRQHYVDLHNVLSVSPKILFSVSARCYQVYLINLSTKTAINCSTSQVGPRILLDHIQLKLEQSGDYLPQVLSIFKEEVLLEEVVSKMESFVAETVKDKETIPRPTG